MTARISAILAALIFSCLILFYPDFSLAEVKKYAIVLGNNEGKKTQKTLQYAESDAQKFFSTLVKLGGFPAENSHLFLGASASEIWSVIFKIEENLKADGQNGIKSLFVFYFSGHADGYHLELGRTSLDFRYLSNFLKTSGANVRLAIIDSCHSGKLVANKGGRRGPGYNISINEQLSSSGYAIITSSAHNELSQESEEVRGSFFTHYLVSALHGAADNSKDGKVTLSEAYKHAYNKTVIHTSALSTGIQHPMYKFRIKGHGDIILTNLDKSQSYLKFKGEHHGRLLLLNHKADTMVAEIAVKPQKAIVLALPAGNYRANLLALGQTKRLQFSVPKVGGITLTQNDFQDYTPEQTVAKGGLFRKRYTHQVEGGALFRICPLDYETPAFGSALRYRIDTFGNWQPTMRLLAAFSSNPKNSQKLYDLSAMAGIGYAFEISFGVLHADALLGYDYLYQTLNPVDKDSEINSTTGWSYIATIGYSMPLGPALLTIEVGGGGRAFKMSAKGWQHRFDGQAVVSIGTQWR